MRDIAVLAAPTEGLAPARLRQPPRALGFVFKVTERCNLACPYCYFFFAGDESYKKHPPLVPLETVEGLIAFANEAISNLGVRQISIGFHGGEPLLLKKDYFAAICTRLRTEIDPRCKVRLSLQTNGVLVDEQWINAFEAHDVSIGVSFDGDEAAHNRTRITRKGKGTYAETLRGWQLLSAAHKAGRIASPYILCVVSPGADGAATLRHFVNELGATGLDFLFPDITHDALDANRKFVSACGQYLIDVCNAWFSMPPGTVHIRFIDQILSALLHDEAMTDSARHKNNSTALLTISSDGSISADDVFRGLSLRFRDTGLRVQQHTYAEVQHSALWDELYSAEDALPTQCQACLWKNVCRGGAKQHRFSLRRGFDNASLYCHALQSLYGFLAAELVRGGYPAADIERRLTTNYATQGAAAPEADASAQHRSPSR